jgi:hypothetical protein
MAQASANATSAVTTTASIQPSLTPNSTPLAPSTNTRVNSGGDGALLLNRSAPDRKTIHSTYPSRSHHQSTTNDESRASARYTNSGTMGSNDGTARYQQHSGTASSMIGGTGSGAQSFLSKLSSKFARR